MRNDYYIMQRVMGRVARRLTNQLSNILTEDQKEELIKADEQLRDAQIKVDSLTNNAVDALLSHSVRENRMKSWESVIA